MRGSGSEHWFPIIDRNPQEVHANIFKAGDSDYIKATQRIYRSKALRHTSGSRW
ncbi:MAG: hypothetical protein IPJ07_20490 [Acidobacteria bacterium]|nr:hypothetical protein [Acidobacteriota bacterium]